MRSGKWSMEGKFGAVIDQYLDSPQFDRLADATRASWERELKLVQKFLGLEPIDSMRPSLIQAHIDGLSDFPGKQATAKSAIKNMEGWAIVRDLLPQAITTGVKTIATDGGHEPWTEAEIETAIQCARPDLARAIALAANTGQRASDVVKMRWSDVEEHDGRKWVNVIQQKTGKQLSIPLLFGLDLDKWERRPPFFLVLAPNGQQYNANWLSHEWLEERKVKPDLSKHKERKLVLHGLRSSTVIRLRMIGFTELEIASLIGMSEAMVARYSRLANQKKMALASVERIENFRGKTNQNVIGKDQQKQ